MLSDGSSTNEKKIKQTKINLIIKFATMTITKKTEKDTLTLLFFFVVVVVGCIQRHLFISESLFFQLYLFT